MALQSNERESNMAKRNLSQQELNKRFSYDPNTGILTHRRLGRAVGYKAKNGYLLCNTSEKTSIDYVHCVVWVMVNGSIPEGFEIDHKNHIRTDNRMSNLRLVSRHENMKNKSKYKNNLSGYQGVFFDKESGKWRAQISINKKRVSLGRFDCISDAIDAKMKAESEFNFHKNHGVCYG